MVAAIVAAVVVLFLLFTFARTIRIVPQARAGIVERFGRYSRTLNPGLTVLMPFIDRLKPLIDLREQVVSFPPQPVITEDNLVVGIDTVLYFTINDPKSATYEVANPLQAIEQITVTTLRNVIGDLTLEEALTSRDHINADLRGVLDEATNKWGIRVNRVEIKSIDPPGTIQEAMEKQMRAERDRRAAILTAEGIKQSQILKAEGEKQAAVLSAEGERQAAILKAEGEAQAIATVFGAIHAGRPDPELLSYQYLQMLPQLAKGDANKVFVIPSEFAEAFGGISKAFTGAGAASQAGPDEAQQPQLTAAEPAPEPDVAPAAETAAEIAAAAEAAARTAAEAAAEAAAAPSVGIPASAAAGPSTGVAADPAAEAGAEPQLPGPDSGANSRGHA